MKFFSEEKAFTLVEILVSLAITSILSLLIGFFMTRQSRQADFLGYRLNMQMVYDKVEQAITSRTILSYSSVVNNEELFNCLNRNSLEPCTVTDPGSQKELYLYDFPASVREALNEEGENATISNISSYQVTGSQDNPAKYSYKTSALCTSETPKASHCQFEVRAFFWATCDTSDEYLGLKDEEQISSSYPTNETALPRECDEASTVHIRFQVKHNRPADAPLLPFEIASIPKDEIFGDYTRSSGHLTEGAISIPVRTIPPVNFRSFERNAVGTFLCGKNEYVTRIEEGSPVCECLYPFSVQEDGSCAIQGGGRCGWGERYRGNDESTGEPICRKIYCENVSVARGCAHGGWIEGIRNNFWFTDETSSSLLTEFNACGVVTDQCAIEEPNESCSVDVLCNQTLTCCYETEPEKSMAAEEEDFLAEIERKVEEHEAYVQGNEGGFEGTLCSTNSDCSSTDYDPKSDITYSLLCCPSGDGSENRCRRGVYQSEFTEDLGYSFSTELTCPTRCHDEMESSTLDTNKIAWAKDYCATLRTVNRAANLEEENAVEGFIEPDDREEYACYSYVNDFGGLRISHEECQGWGYKWGDRSTGEKEQYVGCCDNKCISNFNEFESEGGDESFDKVCNFDDNCDTVFNPDQTNLDKDEFGDACDLCPEDPLLSEAYVSSCGCMECPFEDTGAPDPSLMQLSCEGEACCEDYLCYDKVFHLYHLDTSGNQLTKFYSVRLYPSLEARITTGDIFFSFADEDLIEDCRNNPAFCPLHTIDSEAYEYPGFTFKRIDRPGNYSVTDFGALPEERVIDGSDLLYLRPDSLCSTGYTDTSGLIQDNVRRQICRLSTTELSEQPGTNRVVFSNGAIENGLYISILPEAPSVHHLKLESPPGGASGVSKCAGPFALQFSDSPGYSFSSEQLWIHNGKDYFSSVDPTSGSARLNIFFQTGSGNNPHSELFLSNAHQAIGASSVKLWACVP